MYDLQFLDEPVKGDINFKQDGINIGVDKGSLDQLNNIEIDFIDTLNESGFKFNNPNVEDACGCGESIKFKDVEELAEEFPDGIPKLS